MMNRYYCNKSFPFIFCIGQTGDCHMLNLAATIFSSILLFGCLVTHTLPLKDSPCALQVSMIF